MKVEFKAKNEEMEKYFDERMDRLKKLAEKEEGFSFTEEISNLFGNKYATVGFFESIKELSETNGAMVIAVMFWLSQEVKMRLEEKDKTIDSLQYALDELMRNGVVNGNQS